MIKFPNCRRTSRVRWALATIGGALLVGGLAGAEEPRNRKDLEFASPDSHRLTLDLYLPKEDAAPLVVWIHGGGWRSGGKERCCISWLAGHGYAVASISYRLTDKAIFPAQIHDCKAAVRWLRANAQRYGYSTKQIGVAGSSAGGHLATLLATTSDVKELEGTVGGNLDQSSRVDAVVDYYGPTDFVLRSKNQPSRANAEGSVVNRLLGGGADKKVELAKLASPAFHVTDDDPPLLIFHGDQDKMVFLDQSHRIKEEYNKLKLPVTLKIVEGSGHGGDEFFSGKQRDIVLRFLDNHLRSRHLRSKKTATNPKAALESLGAKFFSGDVEMRIDAAEFGDEELALVAQLDPPLTRLQISSKTTVTSAGLKQIGELAALETLSVSLPDLKDDDVAALAKLTKLQKLTLRCDNKEGVSLTPVGFAVLKSLTHVEELGVGGHNFPPAVLQTVPDVFPQITVLDMNHTFSNNAQTIRAFGRLKHLQKIVLGGNPWLPEDAMAEIGGIRSMQELNLVHTGEKHFRAAIKSLKGHPNLRRITLAVRGDQLTDDLIPVFLTLPRLEEIDLGADEGPLTNAAVAMLAEHPSIKTLTLSHPSFTDEATTYLHKMAALKKLTLDGEAFTDKALAPLAEIKTLRELNIGSYFRSPSITGDAATHLAKLTNVEQLSLTLHENATFPDAALEQLKSALPQATIRLRWMR